jgi:outer membrane receptor for ferrienterochelin and colicin
MDENEIKKRGSVNTSELFRSVPGITIKAANTGGNTIRIRGCQPMVWLDGQRVPNAELDEVITPGDIAGIEFYTSTAGTPAQYMERTNRACGTVLVWTKSR